MSPQKAVVGKLLRRCEAVTELGSGREAASGKGRHLSAAPPSEGRRPGKLAAQRNTVVLPLEKCREEELKGLCRIIEQGVKPVSQLGPICDELFQELEKNPEGETAFPILHALIKYIKMLNADEQHLKAVRCCGDVQRYKYVMRSRQRDHADMQLGYSLDKVSKDLFYVDFFNIRADRSMPESLELLLNVFYVDPDCFTLMEKRHQLEFLASAFWYAEELAEYKPIQHVLNFVSKDELFDSLVLDIKDPTFLCGWMCWMSWIGMESRCRQDSSEEVVAEIENLKEFESILSRVPDKIARDRLYIHYLHVRVLGLDAFYIQEKDNDEVVAKRLISELSQENQGVMLVSQKHAEYLLTKSKITLSRIFLSRDKIAEAKSTLDECENYKLYQGMVLVKRMVQAEIDLALYAKNEISDSDLRKNISSLEASVSEKGCQSTKVVLAQIYIALGNRTKAEEILATYKGRGLRGFKIRAMNLNAMKQFEQASELYESIEPLAGIGAYSTYVDHGACLSDWALFIAEQDTKDAIKHMRTALNKFTQGINMRPGWGGGWNCLAHRLNSLDETKLLDFDSCKRELPSPLNKANSWALATRMAFHISGSDSVRDTVQGYLSLTHVQDIRLYASNIKHVPGGAAGHTSGRWQRLQTTTDPANVKTQL